MELTEPIEHINLRLSQVYGRESNNEPKFRVVWSEDQFEKRWTQHTAEGFELLHPEVRLLPKYRTYIQAKFILERFIQVAPGSELVEKTSYEPIWTFQDNKQNYLPPRYDVCEFVIEVMYQAMRTRGSGHVKYKDPNKSPEERHKMILDMEQKLFGDETDVGDALAHGDAIVSAGIESTLSPATQDEETRSEK